MRLHEDPASFKTIVSLVSEQSGIREDILEKDYYITLLLSQLAEQQAELPAYFKGGTALYKMIGELIRFSEDIDLTVKVQDCSRSQGKRRLEKAANGYQLLARTSDSSLESNKKGSIISVYVYTPLVSIDTTDQLQRFGNIKVEATSFTISEPYTPVEISALIYSHASSEQQGILRTKFGLSPFYINTITMERIFADKILAAEFYYVRGMLYDTAKHIFDIATMMQLSRIQELLANSNKFLQMLAYKREEEKARIGSDLSDKPFSEYQLFTVGPMDASLADEYSHMQKTYVFQEKYLLDFNKVCDQLRELYSKLLSLDKMPKDCASYTNLFT